MNIKAYILKALNLKEEESTKFFLLFFHSFALGLFIAFYFGPVNSIFIKHFGIKELPIAYIAAGIGGYLITSVYSYLQKRTQSNVLFLSALLFMLFVPLIGRVALYFVSEGSELSFFGHSFSVKELLLIFFFMWGWPFISLVSTESGGLAIRFLNLRQVKRLFGLINAGGVIASTIGYLIIPVLLPLVGDAYNLFYFGALGVVVSIILLLLIYKKASGKQVSIQESGEEKTSTRFSSLIKDKYFRIIFLSAILSMTVIYLADFSFLASIKIQPYLKDEATISTFIAIVFGGLKFGELILSIFSSRILSKWGVKLGLSILPVGLCVFIVLANLFGFVYGVSGLAFFAFIVLNKSFERILRRGLDDPSFNVLYQPLPDAQKLTIQTRVGVIMQVAIAIAGILLLGATNLFRTPQGDFNLLHFVLLVFLPLLIIWLIVTRRLYNTYKERLRQILAERGRKQETHKDIYGTDLLANQLLEDDIETVKTSATILSETNPRTLETYAGQLLKTGNNNVIKTILKHIDPTWNPSISPLIKEIKNNSKADDVDELCQKALGHFDYSAVASIDENKLKHLYYSDELDDKLMLIKYLYQYPSQQDVRIVPKLFDYDDKAIKQAALRLAGRSQSSELKSQLVNLLKTHEYHHVCGTTLVEVGEEIVPKLEALFTKEASTSLLSKITEIFARIGTTKTQALLLNHITLPNREIRKAIIKALYYSHFQANEEQAPIIKNKIKEVIGNILWLMVCIHDCESQKNTLKLVQALDLERENSFDILFNLLSFIYQPATIDLIKTNIIGENIIYALEIIDNFIQQDIKQLLIPIVDKISTGQRVRKLRQYYPVKRLKFEERLREMAVADHSKLDMWTRTKAIELLGKVYKRDFAMAGSHKTIDVETGEERELEVLREMLNADVPEEIFQNIHHHDELVYSTAAKVIYDKDPTTCFNYLKTLSKEKQELIDIMENDINDLLTERVKYIKRVPGFFGFPDNVLVKLAKILKSKNVSRGTEIYFIDEKTATENIYIVVKGRLTFTKDNGEEIVFSRNDTIGKGLNLPQKAEKIISKSNSLVLQGNRFEYFNLLVDETEIIQYMFEKKTSRK